MSDLFNFRETDGLKFEKITDELVTSVDIIWACLNEDCFKNTKCDTIGFFKGHHINAEHNDMK